MLLALMLVAPLPGVSSTYVVFINAVIQPSHRDFMISVSDAVLTGIQTDSDFCAAIKAQMPKMVAPSILHLHQYRMAP